MEQPPLKSWGIVKAKSPMVVHCKSSPSVIKLLEDRLPSLGLPYDIIYQTLPVFLHEITMLSAGLWKLRSSKKQKCASAQVIAVFPAKSVQFTTAYLFLCISYGILGAVNILFFLYWGQQRHNTYGIYQLKEERTSEYPWWLKMAFLGKPSMWYILYNI